MHEIDEAIRRERSKAMDTTEVKLKAVIPCDACDGEGYRPIDSDTSYIAEAPCPICEGEGEIETWLSLPEVIEMAEPGIDSIARAAQEDQDIRLKLAKAQAEDLRRQLDEAWWAIRMLTGEDHADVIERLRSTTAQGEDR